MVMIARGVIIGTVAPRETMSGTVTAKNTIIGRADVGTADNYYEVSNESGTTIIID